MNPNQLKARALVAKFAIALGYTVEQTHGQVVRFTDPIMADAAEAIREGLRTSGVRVRVEQPTARSLQVR